MRNDYALEIETIVPSRCLGWLKSGTELKAQIEENDKPCPARMARFGAKLVASICGHRKRHQV